MDAPKKIIIIDDDSIIAEMYAMKFKMEGFEVKTYTDGLSALGDLINFTPDVILLDIMMPGMNGFEVLQSIKKLATSIKAKIIMFSNSSAKENIEKGFDYGADEYLIKAETTPKIAVEKVIEIISKKKKIKVELQTDLEGNKYIICPITGHQLYIKTN